MYQHTTLSSPCENLNDEQLDNNLPDFIKSFDWSQHQTGTSARNARKISPWLLRTKFHAHVDGYDKVMLRNLVAHPEKVNRHKDNNDSDPPELKNLSNAVYTFFDECTALLDEINELILCHLLTTNEELK